MPSNSSTHDDPNIEATAQLYRREILAYLNLQAELKSIVQSLTGPANEAYTSGSENAGTLVEVLWMEVFNAVERAPSPDYTGGPNELNTVYLSRLVDIVDALRQSPAPSAPADRGTSIDIYPIGADSQLWKSLPGFGPEARERWNVDPSSLPGDQKAQASWTNLNGFVALLWSRYPIDQTPEPFDFALYAIWTLRETLEEPQDQKILGGLVQAAVSWVSIDSSARGIWQSCQQERSWPPESNRAPAKTGQLWDQAGKEREDGFSRERWHFWKGRFVQISEMDGVGDDIRKTALAASQRMGEIVGQA